MENTKEREFCVNLYNATSTDDGNGGIESYESWLEKQVYHKHYKLQASKERIKQLEDVAKMAVNDDGSRWDEYMTKFHELLTQEDKTETDEE